MEAGIRFCWRWRGALGSHSTNESNLLGCLDHFLARHAQQFAVLGGIQILVIATLEADHGVGGKVVDELYGPSSVVIGAASVLGDLLLVDLGY
ncbi:hypothetical protein Syun_009311 [Stephania yunnanensis]|uniref:Uncharacterized protein n=1 Tax=Stephania yunnanensis TaxID=152371 RepID=A0AAP0KEE6_9MAGN